MYQSLLTRGKELDDLSRHIGISLELQGREFNSLFKAQILNTKWRKKRAHGKRQLGL